ncbi:MAG: DUF2267 domain-containing protein [Leptolyngbya sp. UWPOB_LEPTO1]|uniref:DUF2267 domain-containing protein n=1 Tax=Leptolyngbya sp. UWPOB_LEPTO1 TaxID=2815653 RepID=UPI001AD5D830|nr:DUF2267 domain-containing protein [Leptolyngbya sp. UWPOB_LEPTO1]MBN8563762.1 DUF2267 domain-containing protein [Leptolyngbya sp. UWPOB_LEPTO1]
MPIAIRDDVVYIMLKKIDESDQGPGPDPVKFDETDFAGIKLTPVDLLGHLDFLNQRQYINAEFSGNAYGNQDDVPNVVDREEFGLRIANTYGAEDGPLPHLIEFKKAELTEKGRKMLEEMEAKPPESLQSGTTVPIATKDTPFLEKVALKGGFSDLYDARDVTEVVFRTMRDMMTNEAVEHVSEELHVPLDEGNPDRTLYTATPLATEVSDLWEDTNPIVHFLSHIRPPLKIKSETFLFRVRQEGGLQPNTSPEQVVSAVFSATKDELSQDRIQEVASFLPDEIRHLWETA